MTPEKLTKLRRAAAMWLQGKPYMPVRFDVLVVLMNGDDVNYEHYEGVTDGAW